MFRKLVIPLIAAIAGGVIAMGKGRSPILWALLCGFLPFMLIVLLFLRPVYRVCRSCGKEIKNNTGLCDGCRARIPVQMVQCPECGKFVEHTPRCTECRSPL